MAIRFQQRVSSCAREISAILEKEKCTRTQTPINNDLDMLVPKTPLDGITTASISPKITTRINVMKDDYETNEQTNSNGPERERMTVSRNQRTLEDVADAKLQPTPRHRTTSLRFTQTILVQKNSIQIL
jgi:hypothetical protein